MQLKRYIGLLATQPNKEFNGWHYFESSVTPTPELYLYKVVIGPFKTKRGALWATQNPFGWGIVADAERLAKAEGK